MGRWVAISLLRGFKYDEEAGLVLKLKNTIEFALIHKGILNFEEVGFLSVFHYEELALLILGKNPSKLFVGFLIDEVLETTSQFQLRNEYHVKNILFVLLERFWDDILPRLSEKIKTKEYDYFTLTTLLQDFNAWSEEKLLKLLKESLDTSLLFVRILRFETEKGEWNPIIINILEYFQTEESLFSELSGAMHSFYSSGSIIPLFESRINLLKKISNHPIQSIREFGHNEIQSFKKRIEEEKRREENYNLGEWS